MTDRVFNRLFSPIDLRGKTLRNRIVFGAHTANMAADGLPSERHVGYYAERAHRRRGDDRRGAGAGACRPRC